MDKLYEAILRHFADRLDIEPNEVETDPKKHPSFYRALMHSAWLMGATADTCGVSVSAPDAVPPSHADGLQQR